RGLRQRRTWIVRLGGQVDAISIARFSARSLEILQSYERLAKQLSGKVKQSRLCVRWQSLHFHTGATTESLKSTVHVVQGGRVGARLRIPCRGTREARNPTLNRFILSRSWCRYECWGRFVGIRQRSSDLGCGALCSSWRGRHHRYVRDSLTVRIDGMESLIRRRLIDEQIVEVQH